MSQPTTTARNKPWEVDANPDFFGVHLLVDGRRFFIPKERLNQVIEALKQYQEQPPICDWLDEPAGDAGDVRSLSVGQSGE